MRGTRRRTAERLGRGSAHNGRGPLTNKSSPTILEGRSSGAVRDGSADGRPEVLPQPWSRDLAYALTRRRGAHVELQSRSAVVDVHCLRIACHAAACPLPACHRTARTRTVTPTSPFRHALIPPTCLFFQNIVRNLFENTVFPKHLLAPHIASTPSFGSLHYASTAPHSYSTECNITYVSTFFPQSIFTNNWDHLSSPPLPSSAPPLTIAPALGPSPPSAFPTATPPTVRPTPHPYRPRARFDPHGPAGPRLGP